MHAGSERGPIYLDYQASTPVDPRVLEALLPYLQDAFGNPSSVQHSFGRQAGDAIEHARRQVAGLINASPREIVFTSGATEANRLALLGLAAANPARRRIISCQTEHPAVLSPLAELEGGGYEVTYLSVDRTGAINIDELRSALSSDTLLVTLMAANNELGTIHPLAQITSLAHAAGAAMHTDGAQAIGKTPIDVRALEVDLLSITGHKLYAPQGVGALFVRRDAVRLVAQQHGGGQEGGLRGGTLNTPGCVGLGAACELAAAELPDEQQRVSSQRNRLAELLTSADRSTIVNGAPGDRQLPGCLHVTIPGVEADAIMASCPEVAMAAGSACASAAPTPSHVLRAIGMPDEDAESSLRLSVGRFTTDEDIDRAALAISSAASAVRDRLRR